MVAPAPAEPPRRAPGAAGNGRRVAKGGALVVLIGGAALLVNQALDRGEGNRLIAYPDPATHGAPWTACRGITMAWGRPVRPYEHFTAEQCAELNDEISADHMAAALRAVPRLGTGCPQHCAHPHQIAAGGSLAYNIGAGAFARSGVAREWNQGHWRQGCRNFGAYRRAAGRVMRGLAIRRAWEQADYCFIDLPPEGSL